MVQIIDTLGATFNVSGDASINAGVGINVGVGVNVGVGAGIGVNACACSPSGAWLVWAVRSALAWVSVSTRMLMCPLVSMSAAPW